MLFNLDKKKQCASFRHVAFNKVTNGQTHKHICTHVHMHVHMHACMHTCTHTHAYTHMHTHTCTHTRTYTYTHTHTHTHTYAHTRTHTHTHTHTYIKQWKLSSMSVNHVEQLPPSRRSSLEIMWARRFVKQQGRRWREKKKMTGKRMTCKERERDEPWWVRGSVSSVYRSLPTLERDKGTSSSNIHKEWMGKRVPRGKIVLDTASTQPNKTGQKVNTYRKVQLTWGSAHTHARVCKHAFSLHAHTHTHTTQQPCAVRLLGCNPLRDQKQTKASDETSASLWSSQGQGSFSSGKTEKNQGKSDNVFQSLESHQLSRKVQEFENSWVESQNSARDWSIILWGRKKSYRNNYHRVIEDCRS